MRGCQEGRYLGQSVVWLRCAWLVAVWCLVFGMIASVPPAAAQQANATGVQPVHWIVWLASPTHHTAAQRSPSNPFLSFAQVDDPLSQLRAHAQVQPITPHGDQLSITFASPAQAADAVSRLWQSPDVAYVEPDVLLHWLYTPNDPLLSQQTWATTVHAPQAWDLTTGRPDIVVAVIDSGVALNHPDLANRLLPGYDFLRGDATPEDEVGHGTEVAGIIAAEGNNHLGIAGIAMDTKILPYKVGDANGAFSSTIARAIYAAVDAGAAVINLSLGADGPSATLSQAIDYAYAHQVVVVAAAGNTPDSVTFPATSPHVISVGGTTADGSKLASFTSRVTRVDVVAPAVDNLTTTWDGHAVSWGTASGTSFAAPIVSGIVALMRSVQPTLTVEQVRAILTQTAHPLSPPQQPGAGAGVVDAQAAVIQAMLLSFLRTWQTADQPVENGQVQRTWLWGPTLFFATEESYADAPHGVRLVAYFDKARMEITRPTADQSSPWYVTTGLLAKELITGLEQTGDATFEARVPAQIPVAGDPDDPIGPTYASFRGVLTAPPLGEGAPVTQTLSRDATVGNDPRLASYGVTAGPLITETGHRVASVFWSYLNSQGLLDQNGRLVNGPLFSPLFYATGLPITEPYWVRATVGGQVKDVLIQCFERRCLTYTPSNPAGWQVEMGNVGQHYARWRYGQVPYQPVSFDQLPTG